MMRGEEMMEDVDTFIDTVFSWSLNDIWNEDFFKDKVTKIPESFQSVEQYMQSFAFPLLEETRAELRSSMEIISTAPFAEVVAIEKLKQSGRKLYDVSVDSWRNGRSKCGKEPYKTLPGDVLVLTNGKPETVSDLQRAGRMWTFVSVTKVTDFEDENMDDTTSTTFRVKASKDIQLDDEKKNSLFLVFLINIAPSRSIWNSIHIDEKSNLKIIKEVLCTNSVVEENCDLCFMQSESRCYEEFGLSFSSNLNDSQAEAVSACLRRMKCSHKSAVELIWGPPGTGKTKTVCMLLFTLLQLKCRTLLCATTNVAVKEVASRVLKLMKETFVIDSRRETPLCSLGDILLFGNTERLKIGADIEEISLDYRVKRLAECFAPLNGWKHYFASMLDFLEDCVSQYQNELLKEREKSTEQEMKEKEWSNETESSKRVWKSFLDFVRERFRSIAAPLRNCIFILCTHVPKCYILENNFQNMVAFISLLYSFENSLFQDNVVSKELEEIFSLSVVEGFTQPVVDKKYLLHKRRRECHSVLSSLFGSLKDLDLPCAINKGSLRDFCFQQASIIFCTASSSYGLRSVAMEPLTFLVIDEAAQLKESESTIPLQLPGVKHAVLVGDECQFQAMVESNVSDEAGFGRSLFERLSSLGHSKHLLNIQYRMHPSISFFPNSNFYRNQILDSAVVKRRSYEKNYLSGPKFGPYSFINIFGGREEFIHHSCRNMVEVVVVLKILRNLYKAWIVSKQKLSIGVISPYIAQVVAIQEKLGDKYKKINGFAVKVKSVEGFQGGEEDIIIISTVRSNASGSIGFISSQQCTNVALTRARYCLWILGNGRTLAESESIWKTIVQDAKCRQCFFNADEDKDLAKAILEVKKEYDELDDLFNVESIIFRSQRWKVVFSDNFLKSFRKLTSVQTKKSVINLLQKLASGWRPKKSNIDSVCGGSLQILKQFKVEGLFLMSTMDVVKELRYIQVLKVWDILPLEEVPKLEKRLENIFARYSEDYINRCKEKCLEGKLEVPKTWEASLDLVRLKNLSNNESGSDSSGVDVYGTNYVENSKVSESLLLMKFYSLSSGVVSHLLFDRDGEELDLPFEVTDEELEIILFPRSTFILGRSGTGKTTILTMKLFEKEKVHHMAMGFYGVEGSTYLHIGQENEVEEGTGGTKKTILHQLFVTVSPTLCFAVKQHISHLKSFAFGGKFPAESSVVDIDDIDNVAQFKDIPNSLVDIPSESYPLVITFRKFLMMLDGTLGISYFNRFHGLRMHSDGQIQTLKSVALEIFIRTKEVNYDRFSSLYWPHFNTQLTKKLDCCRVFTEIISHIKGGLRAMEIDNGKLSKEDYVQLSESRVSTLTNGNRRMIYEIYENYERMKADKGDFDLADLVIDIHRRLKDKKYEGDEMDFVYIDEVQDLTMSQIALFKYICKNVEEGFVFSGDTAQTIARGIDFRFQDIRSLFYSKFLLESGNNGLDGRKDRGQLSKIFSLSQNFRTHAGVLKLAQSIIELLYRFFPQAIDILKPEISLIHGEAPVLLESENNENAIITIFGDSGNACGNIVGFGAQQVILVRDDGARKEISKYVRKQALVLTIVECKGLEFQDVLLYNFFSSSPLKNQWRLIYAYMMEQDLTDSRSPRSFPSFSEAKHNLLCGELKALYVAITRTRQRLWIWEDVEELSRPMYDYWKKKCLVQVRQLNDSLLQAMQVTSTPKEWSSRGMKLFYEHNYEMATMCFERAGDTYWERRSKATGLTATADRIRNSNPEEANIILGEAAEIFEAIGKVDLAAKCFYDLGEFERAGRIYLNKCGESELERAGECFYLAGCYELAADVYARGNFFSECLTVCLKAKLFDMGLQCIHSWKQHAGTDVGLVRRSQEINKIEQDFLKSCALHHRKLKDNKSMMKFVKAFHSMDTMRNFLMSLNCFDELLLLEEESGNFVEAANVAKRQGDILRVADLLEKAGEYKEASQLTLKYVFSNSLWSHGSKGWPLKHFKQKEVLLEKAKSLAKNDSNEFYEFVCTEADILSNEQNNLCVMNQQFNASKGHRSITGEILSARKILDFHLHLNCSKYRWEDEFILDLKTYSEDRICENHVSLGTLVYFWNYWKDKILNVFECLGRLETQDDNDYTSCGDFCSNFFGLWKLYELQCINHDACCFLLNSDADWVRVLEISKSQRRGKLVPIDVSQLVSAARSYWSSELLSVGIKVLDSLEALHKQSIKNSLSLFCQMSSLTYVYEAAKFLLDSKCLHRKRYEAKTLQKFVELSTEQFYGYIVPLDWRQSLSKNVISLRGTEVCSRIVEEFILKCIGLNNELSYGHFGSMAVLILGSGKVHNELYARVAERCDENLPWKAIFESLSAESYGSCDNSNDEVSVSLNRKLYQAIQNTYFANQRSLNYISPSCFLYLLERLLILVSFFQGYFLTTMSSFVDWLIHQEGNINATFSLVTDIGQPLFETIQFVNQIARDLLHDKRGTIEWIKKSLTNVKDYYSLVVLRLVVILCLLHLNYGSSGEILFDLLGWKHITEKLPGEFYNVLRRTRKRKSVNLNVDIVAEAFKKIGNPLVVVSLGRTCPQFMCSDAIFLDMKVTRGKEDILEILFPKIEASEGHAETAKLEATNICKEVPSLDCNDQGTSSNLQTSNSTSLPNRASQGHVETAELEATNLCREVTSLDCNDQGKSSNLLTPNSTSLPNPVLQGHAETAELEATNICREVPSLECNDQGTSSNLRTSNPTSLPNRVSQGLAEASKLEATNICSEVPSLDCNDRGRSSILLTSNSPSLPNRVSQDHAETANLEATSICREVISLDCNDQGKNFNLPTSKSTSLPDGVAQGHGKTVKLEAINICRKVASLDCNNQGKGSNLLTSNSTSLPDGVSHARNTKKETLFKAMDGKSFHSQDELAGNIMEVGRLFNSLPSREQRELALEPLIYKIGSMLKSMDKKAFREATNASGSGQASGSGGNCVDEGEMKATPEATIASGTEDNHQETENRSKPKKNKKRRKGRKN